MLDELLEPKPTGPFVAAHCSRCGRFARYVKGSAGWRYRGDLGDDWDCGTVVCPVHGEQDASWPE